MDFQAVEVTLFAGNEAPVGFVLVKVTAFNAVFVTSCYGKGIIGIERVTIDPLPVFD